MSEEIKYFPTEYGEPKFKKLILTEDEFDLLTEMYAVPFNIKEPKTYVNLAKYGKIIGILMIDLVIKPFRTLRLLDAVGHGFVEAKRDITSLVQSVSASIPDLDSDNIRSNIEKIENHLNNPDFINGISDRDKFRLMRFAAVGLLEYENINSMGMNESFKVFITLNKIARAVIKEEVANKSELITRVSQRIDYGVKDAISKKLLLSGMVLMTTPVATVGGAALLGEATGMFVGSLAMQVGGVAYGAVREAASEASNKKKRPAWLREVIVRSEDQAPKPIGMGYAETHDFIINQHNPIEKLHEEGALVDGPYEEAVAKLYDALEEAEKEQIIAVIDAIGGPEPLGSSAPTPRIPRIFSNRENNVENLAIEIFRREGTEDPLIVDLVLLKYNLYSQRELYQASGRVEDFDSVVESYNECVDQMVRVYGDRDFVRAFMRAYLGVSGFAIDRDLATPAVRPAAPVGTPTAAQPSAEPARPVVPRPVQQGTLLKRIEAAQLANRQAQATPEPAVAVAAGAAASPAVAEAAPITQGTNFLDLLEQSLPGRYDSEITDNSGRPLPRLAVEPVRQVDVAPQRINGGAVGSAVQVKTSEPEVVTVPAQRAETTVRADRLDASEGQVLIIGVGAGLKEYKAQVNDENEEREATMIQTERRELLMNIIPATILLSASGKYREEPTSQFSIQVDSAVNYVYSVKLDYVRNVPLEEINRLYEMAVIKLCQALNDGRTGAPLDQNSPEIRQIMEKWLGNIYVELNAPRPVEVGEVETGPNIGRGADIKLYGEIMQLHGDEYYEKIHEIEKAERNALLDLTESTGRVRNAKKNYGDRVKYSRFTDQIDTAVDYMIYLKIALIKGDPIDSFMVFRLNQVEQNCIEAFKMRPASADAIIKLWVGPSFDELDKISTTLKINANPTRLKVVGVGALGEEYQFLARSFNQNEMNLLLETIARQERQAFLDYIESVDEATFRIFGENMAYYHKITDIINIIVAIKKAYYEGNLGYNPDTVFNLQHEIDLLPGKRKKFDSHKVMQNSLGSIYDIMKTEPVKVENLPAGTEGFGVPMSEYERIVQLNNEIKAARAALSNINDEFGQEAMDLGQTITNLQDEISKLSDNLTPRERAELFKFLFGSGQNELYDGTNNDHEFHGAINKFQQNIVQLKLEMAGDRINSNNVAAYLRYISESITDFQKRLKELKVQVKYNGTPSELMQLCLGLRLYNDAFKVAG